MHAPTSRHTLHPMGLIKASILSTYLLKWCFAGHSGAYSALACSSPHVVVNGFDLDAFAIPSLACTPLSHGNSNSLHHVIVLCSNLRFQSLSFQSKLSRE